MDTVRVHRGRRLGCAFILALTACLFSLPVEATRVRPINLEEMTQRADRIFSGRCVDVRVIEDSQVGSRVTEATFEVDQAVKGALGDTVTIRLHGGPATTGGSGSDVVGQPRFEPGEEVILFLYGESELGLSAPVGLGQGKFTVFVDKHGRKLALNEFGNKTLFHKLSDNARNRLIQTGLESDLEEAKGIASQDLLRFVESLQR